MAARLAEGIATRSPFVLAHPVEANAVFAALPAVVIERLHERYHFYVWDEAAGVVRWMCSWQTTPGDVDALALALRRFLEEGIGPRLSAGAVLHRSRFSPDEHARRVLALAGW